MASIPRFNVTGRYREGDDAGPKNGSRFFAGGDSIITNLTRTDEIKSRPQTANSQRLRNSSAGGNGSGRQTSASSRTSGASGETGTFSDSMSMFSVPASYSGVYYDHVGDDSDEAESYLTTSDLDHYRARHSVEPYYAEYANIDSKSGKGVDEKTPTNSPTPKASPTRLWEGRGQAPRPSEASPQKVSRVESMRDTHRRMKTLAQMFPSFVLDTQVEAAAEAAEEDAKLGFANIPDQMHRKAVKKGFNFTLMIAGESGLGKATLVNSLFMQDLYKDRENCSASDMVRKVTKIEKRQIELDERGVKLRLTIVDTPGFNDAVNAEECWKPIEDYIDSTFEQYFKDECGLNRKNIQDNRVHCCLYFISPYGHGLRQVDVEFMRRLQNKVNIVPVIAKADALTASELRELKERIMSDLDRYRIDIYRLPECDSDEEEEIKRLDKEIKAVLPFAVIGSNCVIEGEGGKKVRGRKYPWGVVEVENPNHCDFTKLRIFLLKTHMQDLKDMTLEVHYENYRAKYITERMSRRQTDRREGLGLARADRDNGPGFEALMGADGLLRQKEDERISAKSLDQMARGKVADPLHLSNGNGNVTRVSANIGATSTTSGTVLSPAGAGTLPPKATLSSL